jgi:hypothetical protein
MSFIHALYHCRTLLSGEKRLFFIKSAEVILVSRNWLHNALGFGELPQTVSLHIV